MSLNAIKLFFKEVFETWKGFSLFQQFSIATATAIFLVLITSLVVNFTSKEYTPLFPADRARNMDIVDIENYLDNSQVPYRVGNDKVIYVPKDKVNRIRIGLAAYGLPKAESSKGYELFDSNTWIKGEKELQVLELRAIKGQLEGDLRQFTNVRDANVSLDIPPSRPFGGSTYKPKASVILDLVPGAKLDSQTIRSMTNHIAGAVRGLSQNMIAVSDTTGRLYQSLDPDGYADTMRFAEVAAEEQLKAKIDGMLSTIVGYDNFYTMVQVTMNRQKVSEERKIYSGSVDGVNLGQPVPTNIVESIDTSQKILGIKKPGTNDNSEAVQSGQVKQMSVPMDYRQITSTPGKIERISIGVLIDDKVVAAGAEQQSNQSTTKLKEEIEAQLKTILKGYNVPLDETVSFVKFDRTEHQLPVIAVQTNEIIPDNNPTTVLIAIIALAVIGIVIFLFRLIQLSMRSTAFREQERTNRQADRKTLFEIEDALNKIKQRLQEPVAPIPTPAQAAAEPKIRKILQESDPTQLAAFLSGETSQTIALILFHLNAERAAAILKEFDFDKEFEVFSALAKMQNVERENLKQLFQSASHMLGGSIAEYESKVANSLITASKVLEQLPQNHQKEIVDRLNQEDGILADRLKESHK
jgi:flagellar biosynthesis/type III secretory pathway M-ring protein FliF/YscJ